MKCNSREYVANCVYMEGASTSKKRRREVRQRKESYTGNNTPFQNRYSKYNATRIMMDDRRYFSRTSASGNFNRHEQ